MQTRFGQEGLLPSDADIAFYEEHGYYVSPQIFSDEEIEDALYGVERFYAGERDFHLVGALKPFEGWRPEHGDVLRVNDYVSLQNQELAALLAGPLLGRIAARLSRSRAVRLWHDQLICKPPASSGAQTAVGWHTDREYWQTCTSSEMLTAWIPFHDCGAGVGPLTVIEGSHKWSREVRLKGFHSGRLEGLAESRAGRGSPPVEVPMYLRKGQVSFHHCRTIHGSPANTGARPRLSLSVHLQDESNRYRAARDEAGEPVWHRNDMLCRRAGGVPDYTDPDICPLLWSEGAD